MSPVRIAAVTGNPRPESRTHSLARTLAAELGHVLDGTVTDVDLAVWAVANGPALAPR